MARIKYSGLIESISGSIAGTTFQANAYGYTIKKKPNMIIPNTEQQLRQQIYFAQAVKAWNELTDAQRLDWNTWASTYPQYAKHNIDSQLSGFAVFTKVHVFRFMASTQVVTNPSYTVYAPDTVTTKVKLLAGVLTLYYNSATEDGDWRANFSVSRPFQDTKKFIGTSCRYMGSQSNDGGTVVITTAYLAQFGALPILGNKVAVSIQQYGLLNGQVVAKIKTVETVVNA